MKLLPRNINRLLSSTKILILICVLVNCNSTDQGIPSQNTIIQEPCMVTEKGIGFYLLDTLILQELNTYEKELELTENIEELKNTLVELRKAFDAKIKEELKDSSFFDPLLLKFIEFDPKPTSDISYYNYDYSAVLIYLDCNYLNKKTLFSINLASGASLFKSREFWADAVTIKNNCDFLLRLGMDYSLYFETQLKLDSITKARNILIVSKIGRYNERFCRFLPNSRYNLRKLREEVSLSQKPDSIVSKIQILEKMDLLVNLFDCSFEEMVNFDSSH